MTARAATSGATIVSKMRQTPATIAPRMPTSAPTTSPTRALRPVLAEPSTIEPALPVISCQMSLGVGTMYCSMPNPSTTPCHSASIATPSRIGARIVRYADPRASARSGIVAVVVLIGCRPLALR